MAYTEIGTLPPWTTYWIPEPTKEYDIDGVLYQHADSCRMLSGPKLLCIRGHPQSGRSDARHRERLRGRSRLGRREAEGAVANFIETLL